MTTANVFRLVILAAIWGGSFIFMRVLAPVLGPILTAEFRVGVAGLVLLLYFRLTHFTVGWRAYWRQYLILGAVNSAIPFALFSFAALHIPASYSVILNSAAPLFGAIFSAIWLNDKLTICRVVGLAVGASGVFLVANVRPHDVDGYFLLAVLACLLATVCYGLAAVYLKKRATGIPSKAIAGASQLTAALVLLPAIPFAPVRAAVTPMIVLNVIGLSLLCSAVAYLLYYRLIAEAGPTKALTVTFLMPAFGMLWGALFLHENITPAMIAGTLLILIGTSLVLRLFARAPHPVPARPTPKKEPAR